MAIVEGPGGTLADTFDTVWDLAEAFAIMVRYAAPRDQAQINLLRQIVVRMGNRARLLERERLADLLAEASEVLQLRQN